LTVLPRTYACADRAIFRLRHRVSAALRFSGVTKAFSFFKIIPQLTGRSGGTCHKRIRRRDYENLYVGNNTGAVEFNPASLAVRRSPCPRRISQRRRSAKGNSCSSIAKELIQPVNVDTPDAHFRQFLLEQFGGATAAALQYWVQSFHVENAGICDMLQDIAIEEFGHLEMVGKLIAQHTSKIDHTSIHDAPIFRVKGGGPHFLDSPGAC